MRITLVMLLLSLPTRTSGFWNKLVGKDSDNGGDYNDSDSETVKSAWNHVRDNVLDTIKLVGIEINENSALNNKSETNSNSPLTAMKDVPFGHVVTPDSDIYPTNKRTIRSIIREQHRYVLFNSRRLQGDCLPICKETKSPKVDSTETPVGEGSGGDGKSSPLQPTPVAEPAELPPQAGCVAKPYCDETTGINFPGCITTRQIRKPTDYECGKCDGSYNYDPCNGRGGEHVCHGNGCRLPTHPNSSL